MLTSETIETLSSTMRETFNFFKPMSDKDLRDFLSFCETKQLPAGETLWREGDSDNYAAFIVSGKVGIKKKTEFKDKYMIVGTFSEGTVVGELCLFTDNLRSVTAEIIEPVYLVLLTSKNFERLLVKNPLLGLNFMKYIFIIITKRLNKTYDRIASMF